MSDETTDIEGGEPVAAEIEAVEEPGYTPPWDLTPTPKEQTPVTHEDLRRLIPQATGDPDADELAKIAELQYSDPAAAERMREDRYIRKATGAASQAAQGQMMEAMAPLLRTQLVASVTQGLPPEAAKYVEGFLKTYTAAAMSNIAKDPNTLDVLRNAAENAAAKVKGPKITAPRTEGAGTNRAGSLDTETEKHVDMMFKAYSHIPGVTKDQIRAELAKEAS